MSTFMREQSFSCDRCCEIDDPNNLSSVTSTSSDGTWFEIYDLFMYLFFIHCAAHILDSCWCRILFITCCHDSLLDLMWNLLCDVLVVIIHHVMLWDPLLYVVGILFLSSCMFVLTSLLCHVGRMLIMHVFCVILIGFFWLRFLVVEHLLEPLMREGIFPCMIDTSSLWTSLVLIALNATAYTILTPGPRNVVPPGRTPLSTAYVLMC